MKTLFPECVGVSYLQQDLTQVVLLVSTQCLRGLFTLPLFLGLFTLPVAYLVQFVYIVDGIRAGDVDHYFVVRPQLEYLVPLT